MEHKAMNIDVFFHYERATGNWYTYIFNNANFLLIRVAKYKPISKHIKKNSKAK